MKICVTADDGSSMFEYDTVGRLRLHPSREEKGTVVAALEEACNFLGMSAQLTVSAELAANIQRMKARTWLDADAQAFEQGRIPTRPAVTSAGGMRASRIVSRQALRSPGRIHATQINIIDRGSIVRQMQKLAEADTLVLTPVLQASGISRNQFNDWVGLVRRSKILKTKFERTEPGSPRQLSFENAVEIGFVAALTRAGVKASKAVELASKWRQQLKEGTLAPLFSLNPLTLQEFACEHA